MNACRAARIKTRKRTLLSRLIRFQMVACLPRISLASDLVLLVATCEQPPLVACPCHKITARVISAPTSLGRQSKQKDIVVRGGVGRKHKRQRWVGIEKREPTKKCHINATHCEDELNHNQQQQYPIRMTHRTVLSAGSKSSLAGAGWDMPRRDTMLVV